MYTTIRTHFFGFAPSAADVAPDGRFLMMKPAEDIRFLKSQRRVDGTKIGLVGHSDCAMIAPRVAADMDDLAFIVLLAGTGVNGEEILYLQSRIIAKAAGATDEFSIRWEIGLLCVSVSMFEFLG